MYMFVHGLFVIVVFSRGFIVPGGPFLEPGAVWQIVTHNHLEWAILGFVISHDISFVHNYLRLGEYRQASAQMLMQQPYGRVAVLHLTIIYGGFVMMALHSPVAGLALLVLLKTALDLRAHLRERQKFTPSLA